MSMKARWFAGVIGIMAFVTVGAAQQTKEAPKTTTLAGKISDAHCGAGKHTMGKSDAECATACAKDGGYVFVSTTEKDKVYKIANQNFTDLPKHAGHTVELTGSVNGDSITISKIAMPKATK